MSTGKQSISPDTITRTVVLILALLNEILAIVGHEAIPFADNDIYQAVSLLWTIAASLLAWWKNNSFTCLACAADEWKKCRAQTETEHTEEP